MHFEIIDLSHPINSYLPVFPGDPSPEIKALTSIEEKGYRVTELSLSSHIGTHIDSPAHILENGKFLGDYPLSSFYGKGKVLNCVNQKEIDIETISNSLVEEIPDFLLLKTKWDENWDNENYYTNYPVLSIKAAEFLANLPIKGIGIDFPSVDLINAESYFNHSILLQNNILIIENICNLQSIATKDFIFSCFPLSFNRADGSPTRACAIIENK